MRKNRPNQRPANQINGAQSGRQRHMLHRFNTIKQRRSPSSALRPAPRFAPRGPSLRPV